MRSRWTVVVLGAMTSPPFGSRAKDPMVRSISAPFSTGLGYRRPKEKTTPSRGMVSAPSCELKTCTLATCSAWASGHFSAQTAGRDSSARFGVKPTGNRDAGKFAPDATQLPTGCQPESLAKPARRRSHKPRPPGGPPEPFAPPCIRHLPPITAACLQGAPARVRAPHRWALAKLTSRCSMSA
jgi:hypothetical protein